LETRSGAAAGRVLLRPLRQDPPDLVERFAASGGCDLGEVDRPAGEGFGEVEGRGDSRMAPGEPPADLRALLAVDMDEREAFRRGLVAEGEERLAAERGKDGSAAAGLLLVPEEGEGLVSGLQTFPLAGDGPGAGELGFRGGQRSILAADRPEDLARKGSVLDLRLR
jgi:hypothetical protein